jgi:hypothetical protein
MNDFFRGIIAAWGAKKLGGGCLFYCYYFCADLDLAWQV